MPDPRPRLILTRPRVQAERFAAEIEARCPDRFAVLIAPLLEIEPVDATPDLDGVEALIFTSENGVRRLAELTDRRDIPAYCVGDRTAAAARTAGFGAQSAAGDAAALLALIRARLAPGTRVLHLRGRHAARELAPELARAGFSAGDCILYDQVSRPLDPAAAEALRAGGTGLVALFSPRTAGVLATEMAGHPAPGFTALCLSDAVARALKTARFRDVETAARPDARAMLDAIAAWN